MGRARELSKFPEFSEGLALGGGAYLGGTTAANLLDDYEEGTWTPTVSPSTGTSAVTYGTRIGWYRKIGDLVTVSCEIPLTSVPVGGSGRIKVSGLPFPPTNNSGVGSVAINNVSSGTAANFVAVVIPVENEIAIYLEASTLSSSNDAWGRLSSTSAIEVSIIYV